MITLQEILGESKNIDQIESWATSFGFTNVRLYCVIEEETMQLLVSDNPNSENYPAAFEAMLRDKFRCEILLIVEPMIKSFLKSEILDNSIPIRSTIEIVKRLSNELSYFEIASLKTDTASQNALERAKQHAQRILDEEKRSLCQKREDKQTESAQNFLVQPRTIGLKHC